MNKNSLLRIAAAALLFLPIELNAQEYSRGKETRSAEVNLRDLAKYYETHPLQEKRKMPNEEDDDEERPYQPDANPAEIHLIKRGGSGRTSMMPPSPVPTDSFLSTVSPGYAIPPDTHGAVDSQYCVTAINTSVHIQTRAGGNVLNLSLDGFWAPLMGSGVDAFDPRVHYDPYNKRWIMIGDAYGQTDSSAIMIAVSVTGDPTGTWHMYSVRADATGASWLDFPNVGFNSKWICVTGNMFPLSSGGASGAVVYVFDYARIMAGTGAPFTKISKSSSFSICPALTYDMTQPNMYALETWRGNMGQLRLWKISGPVASPTMTSIGYPTTSQHWRGSGSGGDFGPQVGTTNKINIGDDRITNVIYRNKKLWCAHSAFLPASTATHCATMWWQVDTLANPIQNGLVNDATATNFYAYPSIAVNKNDDALIGLAYLSSAIHPSAGYALRLHTDPVDSIRTPQIYRHGQATYYVTFGGGRNRWGDYSGTCVDSRNDEDFWTIQETSTTSSTPNWDTWWSKVQICPKPAPPTMAVTPSVMCVGGTGTYVVNPIAGATSYTWSMAGSGWSSITSNDSLFVTAATGTATVSVYATNACGQGESNIFTISTTPPPATPVITTIVHACVGSVTAVFSATSAGATAYSWLVTGGGWSGSSGSTSLTASVGTGTGMIICSSTNGCGSSTPDTLLVTPAVVPPVAFSVTTHVIDTGSNVTITAAAGMPAGSTYSWSWGGGIATPGTGAGPHTVHWGIPGTKTVTLTVDNNGCDSSYSDTVHVYIDHTSVRNINASKVNFSISPNPNTGSFDVVLTEAVSKNITVKIADMQGRIVYTKDFAASANGKLSVKTDDLPAGIYAVTLYIDGTAGTKKVTITK